MSKTMKKTIWMAALVAGLFACSGSGHEHGQGHGNHEHDDTAAAVDTEGPDYGVPVDLNASLTLTALEEQMVSQDSMGNVTVTGVVSAVCQSKGCWMNLKRADDSEMKVTFKDYALFMPKDIVGKEVAIHGVANRKEVSVETLRHYAEDAGKPKEEIEAINAPEVALAFEADGVLIK